MRHQDAIVEGLMDIYNNGVRNGFIRIDEASVLAILGAADEIERLRTLITEWADAEDLVVIDSDLRLYAAHNNLRKAVGR